MLSFTFRMTSAGRKSNLPTQRRENLHSKAGKFPQRVNGCFKLNSNHCDQIWQEIATLAFSFKPWALFKGFLLFFQILNLLLQILFATGQIFIDVNGHMLKNNLAIWSHWLQLTRAFTDQLFNKKKRILQIKSISILKNG